MSESWKRPSTVPFPSTWAIVEGRKPMSNGKKPRFRIQDISDDLATPAVQHMQNIFLFDEPYCNHLDLGNIEDARNEIGLIWHEVLKHKIGLIALLDNAEEFPDEDLPNIAGVNMTFVMFPDSKDPKVNNPKVQSVFNIVHEISHRVNSFEKYNVPLTMYALGLSVDRAYRGQGLGEHIVKARISLGKATGIPLTTTVFTGPVSQGIAKKVGFDLLAEMDPEQYIENGKAVFKGVNSKTLQLMSMRLY